MTSQEQQQQQQQQQEAPPPPPSPGGAGGGVVREATYLPGPSHPLHAPPSSLSSPTSGGGGGATGSRRRGRTASGNSNIQQQQQQQHAAEEEGELELAVMELSGIVVFPGDTLPIRVVNRAWMEYLGRRIDAARTDPGGRSGEVRFGVLTKQTQQYSNSRTADPRVRRQSWTRRGVGPRRLSRFSQRLIEELGDMDDLSREDDVDDDENGSDNSHDGGSADDDENMDEDGGGGGGGGDGDAEREQQQQQQQQPAQEEGAGEGNEEADRERVLPRVRRRFRLFPPRIRRREVEAQPNQLDYLDPNYSNSNSNNDEGAADADDEEEADDTRLGDGGGEARETGPAAAAVAAASVAAADNNGGGALLPQAEEEDDISEHPSMPSLGPPRGDLSDTSDSSHPSMPQLEPRSDDSDTEDIRRRRLLPRQITQDGVIHEFFSLPETWQIISMQQQVQEPVLRILPAPFDNRQPQQQMRGRNNATNTAGAYHGRIGTIVTVVFTHGDANDDNNNRPTSSASGARSSSVWRSHDEQGQLVVTALGTSRFRILAAAADQDGSHHFAGVMKFRVEELEDEPIDLPSKIIPNSICRSIDCSAMAGNNDSVYAARHRQLARSLSLVTPVPSFVYQRVWPWSLLATIRETLERLPAFAGVLESLPSMESTVDNEEARRLMQPLHFSYWMASNLPLGQDEKLELLELHSTVERLKYIQRKIRRAEEVESVIQCGRCGIPLAQASQMFSVGGTAGTTGNYVNEYGAVHQTITVRQLDEDEVGYQGGAETQDSWFPGYSWTIMNCGFCSHHLGWKFRLVDGDTVGGDVQPPPERPAFFFGLSAASVITYTPEHNHHDRRSRRAVRGGR